MLKARVKLIIAALKEFMVEFNALSRKLWSL